MRLQALILFLLFSCVITAIKAQDFEIDKRNEGEPKMIFPSIYFNHNSTDYAIMPYTVDSCFKYIAFHFKENINSLVIWRDSTEKEELTIERIKKLRSGLKKYVPDEKIEIHSMGNEQKISRRTINMTTDSVKVKYLLSLNSVFDISKTRFPSKKTSWLKRPHTTSPRVWCYKCWKNHRFTKDYRRIHVKKKKR